MRAGFWGLLAAILAAMASPADAGERDVVVGVEELDYAPIYAWRGGAYGGAARDILDAFAADRGWHLTYRALPIKRLFAELVSGGIDLKFPDSPKWATEAKGGAAITYSRPVIDHIDGVMVLPAHLGQTIRILGTVAGFTPLAWQDRIKSGEVVLKQNPRLNQLVHQALLQRIDGAYASVAVVNRALATEFDAPGALVFDPSLPHTRSSYLLSSGKRPDLIADFDAWLAGNADRVKAIKARWQAEKGVN